MTAAAPYPWPNHAPGVHRGLAAGGDLSRPLEARRCTVQLSTGRLYLDAIASPSTALLGHDSPQKPSGRGISTKRLLSSLAPGYAYIAATRSFRCAVDLAGRLARSAVRQDGQIIEIIERDALAGEPTDDCQFLVAHENETLGRTGRWLASSSWKRLPDLIVVGDSIALGGSFGAVLAREDREELSELARPRLAPSDSADPVTLARVAAAITTVENEGLLHHGRELAVYLYSRLLAVRRTCPEIECIEASGLSFRVSLAPPLPAAQIRRGMCERGVLVGVDADGRLAIEPPLPLRIAEADVITGALRGAILQLPLVSAAACCAACEKSSK